MKLTNQLKQIKRLIYYVNYWRVYLANLMSLNALRHEKIRLYRSIKKHAF